VYTRVLFTYNIVCRLDGLYAEEMRDLMIELKAWTRCWAFLRGY
jgi:hypothetical protein